MYIRVKLSSNRHDDKGWMIPDHRWPNFWPATDDERFPLLRWLDQYSDTIFSQRQMNGLIPELEFLLQTTPVEEAKPFLQDVIKMAERCRDNVHYLLYFKGQ